MGCFHFLGQEQRNGKAVPWACSPPAADATAWGEVQSPHPPRFPLPGEARGNQPKSSKSLVRENAFEFELWTQMALGDSRQCCQLAAEPGGPAATASWALGAPVLGAGGSQPLAAPAPGPHLPEAASCVWSGSLPGTDSAASLGLADSWTPRLGHLSGLWCSARLLRCLACIP